MPHGFAEDYRKYVKGYRCCFGCSGRVNITGNTLRMGPGSGKTECMYICGVEPRCKAQEEHSDS